MAADAALAALAAAFFDAFFDFFPAAADALSAADALAIAAGPVDAGAIVAAAGAALTLAPGVLPDVPALIVPDGAPLGAAFDPLIVRP